MSNSYVSTIEPLDRDLRNLFRM